MTGFSQALETQKAHEIGADDFLAKPFNESDLLEIIKKHFEDVKAPVAEAIDLDKEYCKISLEDFISEKEVEYSIFIRIKNAKYIRIAHQGGKISEDRIRAFKAKGLHHVYIRREDFSRLVGFNLKIAKILQASSKLGHEKKMHFMSYTADLILEGAFVKGVDQESFQNANEFIKTSMEVLADDVASFSILNVLSTHADHIYAHSLGVSTFCVMIAKEMGWTSAPVLFKLAQGGLFHDVGKKEIDREILEKPRALLTQSERAAIETHTLRGREILESIKGISTEVIQMSYQHHEDEMGRGYPRRITKKEIHPFAKICRVANVFCEYAIKSHPHIEPVSPEAALRKMILYDSDSFDKDVFAALKRLFKFNS
jgi:putative nucleotidyltransferase with HDIG domain